ncbi:hypothetical protein SAMN05216588_101199 [Pseudomonas flavescens]|uniref:Uncharacterized protein n=1 Tax=Phytopseudomonas flavescens TaxID=29435 RepID=A0A1G7XMT9_9GAMM|nr:hypothetical protein [Pseudomonas flavescens]SDG85539.1 hypothetical protein SAMN05216588_101199 [Pseudomonas flavescens]
MSSADQILAQLYQDDGLYCSKNLKIRDKAGNILPFEWNEAQCLLHAKVEEQLTQGWVRVIVLKGDSRALAPTWPRASTVFLLRRSIQLSLV